MKVLKVTKIIVMVLAACALMSWVVMLLWNWLMPAIFGLHTLTFAQALGLLVLSKILLGGFHRHGGGARWRRRAWRKRMEARWAKMTPEERERFRAGMRGRHACGFRRNASMEQQPQ